MAPRFFGRFEHSLDAKGRIILPARFRGSFDTQAYLSQHHDRCLAVWTPEHFEKEAATMEAMADSGPQDRNLARFWASGIIEVELDRQGRVPIPGYLREFARLDTAVLITGVFNRIELWNPTEWVARVGPNEAVLGDSILMTEASPGAVTLAASE
ncbi:MAG: division/cell wall cluster transcriptional repressor MraZ [Actinomycetota bacterium]|nr:division/cell wall cluster transcriptional repressor MraZ [Actinomycetota bacterium]